MQSKDYDLEGEYIRKWIPELANVPQSYIHEPWKMPPDVAAQVPQHNRADVCLCRSACASASA